MFVVGKRSSLSSKDGDKKLKMFCATGPPCRQSKRGELELNFYILSFFQIKIFNKSFFFLFLGEGEGGRNIILKWFYERMNMFFL
jgi:hypothetical protein